MINTPHFEPLRVPAKREIELIAGYRDKCAYQRRMLYHGRKAVFKKFLEGKCEEDAAKQQILDRAEAYYGCMTQGAKGSLADPPEEAAQDMHNFLTQLIPTAGLKE
jgi:hypothetical protein